MKHGNEWLLVEIATGLQKLACLSLDRTPAAELLAGTAHAWMEAVTANNAFERDRDAHRIRKAFVTLATTRDHWPAPRHFLDALPRVETAAIGYEVKPASKEEADAAMAKIRSLLKDVPTFKPEPKEKGEPIDKAAVEAELQSHYADRKTAAAGGEG